MNCEKEDYKAMLRDYIEQITHKSKGGLYACPLCGSGTGANKSGALSIAKDGQKWTCFSCGKNGDVFDLIGEMYGIDGFSQRLQKAREIFGSCTTKRNESRNVAKKATEEKPEVDFSEYIAACAAAIEQTDYHRGITLQTLQRFSVGYDAANRVLVIPTSSKSILQRQTEGSGKYKHGSIHFLNVDALYQTEKPVYIVEGEIDALSIEDVGGKAVALGSTAYINRFLQQLDKKKPLQTLILALDNDDAGEKAARTLAEALKNRGIFFYRASGTLYGKCKDASEALNTDRTRFKNVIESTAADAARAAEEKKAAKNAEGAEESAAVDVVANYKKDFAAGHSLQGFLDTIMGNTSPKIPTGYSNLDAILYGGMRPGLYVIGAIPSLGKTTYALQMADSIAASGKDVLIFSLEMAKTELMAKSISRHTLLECEDYGVITSYALAAAEILDGERWANGTINAGQKVTMRNAVAAYAEYADRIYISEGMGETGVQQVKEAVEKHISFTGAAPVVFVDYLQILSPFYEHGTDKQNIDKAVLELKRISRDFKTPVIAISSLNRAGYNAAVTMESFKESGAVEYSADVLIGLQLQGAGQAGFDVNVAKSANPRTVEAVILKNRNGKTGGTLQYSYYPKYNLFRENASISQKMDSAARF